MSKDAIRFPASFYKCLSPRISCLPQILNQTQNKRSHHSHFYNFQLASTMFLYSFSSVHFHFSFVSMFQPSQSHLNFLQSPLKLLHTLVQVCLFLDLWRGEYKVNNCSDAAGGTMHWWVGWFQAEGVPCEFSILHPETLISGNSHISRHPCPWRSEKLYPCTCQTSCQIR